MPDTAHRHDQRLALIDRIINELAIERGIDVAEGISFADRSQLIHDAEVLIDDWFERIRDGEPITVATPVEALLAELFELDSAVHDMMEGGRAPDTPLH